LIPVFSSIISRAVVSSGLGFELRAGVVVTWPRYSRTPISYSTERPVSIASPRRLSHTTRSRKPSTDASRPPSSRCRKKALVIPVARSMMLQTEMVIRLFGIEVLDLTAATVRSQLRELELQTRGVRAADALHLATAVAFDADTVVTADNVILALDNVLKGQSGQTIRCLDSDAALRLI
jgi:predicted nucleic acid-binding protein